MNVENTISTSKGVFVFQNMHTKSKRSKTKLDKLQHDKLWYITYKNNWKYFEHLIQDFNQKSYNSILNDIVDYIKMCYSKKETVIFENLIPSAALVTSVNQSDNISQYYALIRKLREDVTSHVAIAYSQHATKVKQLVEYVVWQLMDGDADLMETEDYCSPKKTSTKILKQRNMYNMSVLKKWYQNTYSTTIPSIENSTSYQNIKPLVIILPEFESFICDVLQDFVMILSSYLSVLPIVLVFGVATSVSAVHKSFPYQVSSKLTIKVFHSFTSEEYLNKVIRRIILNHRSPFHLSAKVFKLLTDVFLFHDFSVTGFIQNLKYCMKYHMFWDDTKALCCRTDKVPSVLSELSSETMEKIRRLPSFRPYLESQSAHTKIALFEDDSSFKCALNECIESFYDHLFVFYTALGALVVIVNDLPKNPLGKSIQELYVKCTSVSMTKTREFDECMQLLSFQSQSKLEKTCKNALKEFTKALNLANPKKLLTSAKAKDSFSSGCYNLDGLKGQDFINTVETHLIYFLNLIQTANIRAFSAQDENPSLNESEINENNSVQNRYQLKEKLLLSAKVRKTQSEFEISRAQFVDYMKEMFSKSLVPFNSLPFYEIFVFDDIANIEKQIIGSPHGAIHSALNNPVDYLHCSCCTLSSEDSIVSSLPDTSIVYKLHLECGKLINLYDWLQAFAAVVMPSDEDERDIPPQIQARFSRAVSVLYYHGYIKSSKRKPNHVMRLTW